MTDPVVLNIQITNNYPSNTDYKPTWCRERKSSYMFQLLIKSSSDLLKKYPVQPDAGLIKSLNMQMFLVTPYQIYVVFDGYKLSFCIFVLMQLSFLETSNVTCTLPEGRMPWNMSPGSPVLGCTRVCTTSTLQDKLLRTPRKGVENGWRTATRYTDKSREMLDYNLQAVFRWET